jgi:hypothetical protein
MLTVTDPRPLVKPARRARKPYTPPATTWTLHVRPGEGDSFGVLQIVHGKDDDTYYLFVLRSDFGLCYRLDKLGEVPPGGDDHYCVCLDAQDGHHTCECRGFLRWGRCKHVKALAGCHRDGLLPVAHQPAPAADAA